MKQKDLGIILVIVFISAIFSFFVSKYLFAPPKNRQQAVEIVQPISADFPKPDSNYFNQGSFDPTQPITVGQANNSNPFNGTGN